MPYSKTDKIIQNVAIYYSDKITRHGTTPAGVDWKNSESQYLRFAQLQKLLQNDLTSSLLDVGCGYGAFLVYARQHGFTGHYTGYDCTEAQINAAKIYVAEILPQETNHDFIQALSQTKIYDFAVASGIFSVKLNTPAPEWRDYIFSQLDMINAYSRRGFAFNCLTSHVDWRRDDLYYADPVEFFSECRKRYGRHLALLHDYGLYEFSLIVRKDL